MNGSTQKLTYTILGAMFLLIMSLSGIAYGLVIDRLSNIEDRQAAIEEKIGLIQGEYYRIAVMEGQLRELLRLSR